MRTANRIFHFICACILLLILVPASLKAQCLSVASPSSMGIQDSFPVLTGISVYIDSRFDDQNPGVISSGDPSKAVTNWQSAVNTYAFCSGVTFAFVANPGTTFGSLNIFYRQINTPTEEDARGTISILYNVSRVYLANITVNMFITSSLAVTETTAHEIGHIFGLGDCHQCSNGTVMSDGAPSVNSDYGLTGPTICDMGEVLTVVYDYQCPPPPSGGGGCRTQMTCTEGFAFDEDTCDCEPSSPIIVDTDDTGFHLTSAIDGVDFDLLADGQRIRTAWTAAGSRNAFLALDRNGNGVIDDGSELFGSATSQPKSNHPNGFLALAEFDRPENGGNANGVIDSGDAVFSKLVLWIDANHDGISQPGELHSLKELGIVSIDLHYTKSLRSDQYGNVFRYRAKVSTEQVADSTVGRWAYDVFFATVKSASGTDDGMERLWHKWSSKSVGTSLR